MEALQKLNTALHKVNHVLSKEQKLFSARTLPWLLLGLCVVFLGWQQVRLSTLTSELQEREQDCTNGSSHSKSVAGPGGISTDVDDVDAGGADAAEGGQISVEEELDALYKQLNEQTNQLTELQRQKETLEARRNAGAAANAGGVAKVESVDIAGWVFHQGYDFDGFDLVRKPAMRDKPAELVEVAANTPKCVAFNTNGWLKSGVAPKDTWYRWTDDATKGVWVLKDVDMTL